MIRYFIVFLHGLTDSHSAAQQNWKSGLSELRRPNNITVYLFTDSVPGLWHHQLSLPVPDMWKKSDDLSLFFTMVNLPLQSLLGLPVCGITTICADPSLLVPPRPDAFLCFHFILTLGGELNFRRPNLSAYRWKECSCTWWTHSAVFVEFAEQSSPQTSKRKMPKKKCCLRL